MKTSSGRQFQLFVLTGGAAAFVNVLSRIGFSMLFRFELAVAACSVGMVTAYILARRYVFTDSGQSIKKSLQPLLL